MDLSKISTGTIVSLVVGILLGFALGAYTYSDNKDQVVETETATTTEKVATEVKEIAEVFNNDTEKTLSTTNANVSATDQLAGGVVAVESVEVEAVSWVAVRDWNDGVFGRILGAKRIEAGASADLKVELLRNTEAGKTYAVVLYEDDGDRVFNHKADSLLESNGRIVAAVFDAQ